MKWGPTMPTTPGRYFKCRDGGTLSDLKLIVKDGDTTP